MISSSAHVVVIGGGVLGSAIAFRLTQSGVRVTLVERDAFGEHASGKNAGNLNPIFMAPPMLTPLSLESFRLHPILAEELAKQGCARYEVKPVRRLLLAFNEAERMQLNEVAALFSGHEGFSAQLLDTSALRILEPRLADDVLAGLLMEGNMALDSHALNCALVDGAARLGATLVRAGVHSLGAASGRVCSVGTQYGNIPCDAVVLATGPWVSETLKWLGLKLPIEPVKGQLLRMKLPGKGLEFDLTHGMISLYRRGRGEVWVGVTKERIGLDETPTEQGRQQLLAEAIRIMPEMADALLLEHSATLRPMTPSGLPIIGQAPGWDNVYIANGGGFKGVLLCTGIAQAMLDLMLTGGTGISLAVEAMAV